MCNFSSYAYYVSQNDSESHDLESLTIGQDRKIERVKEGKRKKERERREKRERGTRRKRGH
jgi:hypothetical protein